MFRRILAVLIATMLLLTGCNLAEDPEQTSVTTPTANAVTATVEPTPIPIQESVEDTTLEPTVLAEETAAEPEEEPTPESTEETAPYQTEEPEVVDNSYFWVRYIDVGQADAALVNCDGHYMLIDGGNVADSSLIYSVLKNENANHLDIVIGTHAHEDHIGGLSGALNYATADLVLCPVTNYDSKCFSSFVKYANKNGNGIQIPSVGDIYELGSSKVEILGLNGGSDTNDTSIVLKITYGETKFLFSGDAERDAEQAILNRGADISADVLKVGHHGSETSTTYPYLREIMPSIAVISVGEGNSYGHPTDACLSKLRDADVTVYRTDLNGDITITSDGSNLTVSTDKTATREEILTPCIETTPEPETIKELEESEEEVATGTTYIANKNTKKFHKPGCASIKKMKDSNKIEYCCTREEMIEKGYEPCKNCNP